MLIIVHLNEECWLIVCNLSEQTHELTIPQEATELIIANYDREVPMGEVELRPYEAFVVKIR